MKRRRVIATKYCNITTVHVFLALTRIVLLSGKAGTLHSTLGADKSVRSSGWNSGGNPPKSVKGKYSEAWHMLMG